MHFTWLHISDIHFHFSSYESLRLREEFLNRVHEISDNKKIDYVFLTGDLADKNGEYNKALVLYLNEIAKAAGVIKDNFIIVPGNHDHDRTATLAILNSIYEYYNLDPSEGTSESDVNKKIDSLLDDDKQVLENSFSNFDKICTEFYGSGNKYYKHSVVKQTSEEPIIVRINTCMFDRSSNDEMKELHLGMKNLLESTNDEGLKNSEVNLAIGHHPASLLCDEEKDRFLDFLHSKGINLYLCGHKHKPELLYYDDFDIYEVICSYGNSDKYSMGGFSIGLIDTIHNQYYVDFYNWMSGERWVRDTSIKYCDETGRCYLNGKQFRHIDNPKIVVPIKMFGPSIPNQKLLVALKNDYELFPYLSDEITDVGTLNWENEIDAIIKFADSVKAVNDKQVNVFPLAPIPILISFGYALQHNSEINIFQFDRDNNLWLNNSNEECPEYTIKWGNKSKKNSNNTLIIKISTSTEILDKQLPNLKNADIIELSLLKKKLGFPLYNNHFNKMLNSLFDDITPEIAKYEEVHLFASVPAGMAIEIGRRIQKGVFPKVVLYNFFHGYTKTNTINE